MTKTVESLKGVIGKLAITSAQSAKASKNGENKSGENSDKESYSLAFYLELSSLGNIKINVKVGLNSMEVRMDVDREDIAEFVRNSASEFEERMKLNGLNTSVECLKEEQVLPIKDNLIELLVSKNTSLLNVKT